MKLSDYGVLQSYYNTITEIKDNIPIPKILSMVFDKFIESIHIESDFENGYIFTIMNKGEESTLKSLKFNVNLPYLISPPSGYFTDIHNFYNSERLSDDTFLFKFGKFDLEIDSLKSIIKFSINKAFSYLNGPNSKVDYTKTLETFEIYKDCLFIISMQDKEFYFKDTDNRFVSYTDSIQHRYDITSYLKYSPSNIVIINNKREQNIKADYDNYGIVKNVSIQGDHNNYCRYESIDNNFIISAHKLIIDIFDLENNKYDNLWVVEKLVITDNKLFDYSREIFEIKEENLPFLLTELNSNTNRQIIEFEEP
jgi:hypothetical protein